MGLKKIIENLQKALDAKKNRTSRQIETIEDLLDRLERKKTKYQARLAAASGEKEKRKASRHLKVCKAQLEKGRAVLQELRKEVD